MEYFAGLDVSMAETHVCVMNRDADLLSLGTYGAIAIIAPEEFLRIVLSQP